jgi:hypothetical protein
MDDKEPQMKEQIQKQILELEQEQELNEFGSVAYDFVDAELQSLYCQLDRLVDEQ